MENIMASKNGGFTPSCMQFKECEILCIFCWEKVKFRIICGTPHISSIICPENSCFFLSLSLSLSSVFFCVPNLALLFITETLLSVSTHYTSPYIKPNNDMLQQNTTLHGPKPQITVYRATPTTQY
jgi:hypothetical protein